MLDALHLFVLVADHRTFTAAARRAHLSQPALSAAIQRLEHQLGARLFHRGRAGAEPTAAGAALLPRARAALAAVEDGRRAVAEVAGLRAGDVRIGGGATVCTYLLPAHLADFRRRHPAVRFQVREAYPEAIRAAVAAGEIDLGVVSDERASATGRTEEHWRWDELIVVVARGAAVDLAREPGPFVSFTEGSSTRAHLLRHLPGADIVMELGSIAAIKENVRAGIGLALLSRAAAEVELAAGKLVEVPTAWTPVRRRLSLVHRGVDRLPPGATALRALLLAAADDPRGPVGRARRGRGRRRG